MSRHFIAFGWVWVEVHEVAALQPSSIDPGMTRVHLNSGQEVKVHGDTSQVMNRINAVLEPDGEEEL